MAEFFSIKADVDGCLKDLKKVVEKQIPYAISLALNRTAFDCKDEIRKLLPSIFDRPTPWVLNALKVTKDYKKTSDGYKRGGTVALEYKSKPHKGFAAAEILSQHIYGGSRTAKRSEWLLRSKGRIPSGSFIIPSRYANIDQYGNVRSSQVMKMLSGLQATFGSHEYSKGKKGKMFYVSRNKKAIFLRQDKEAHPIFWITKSVNYKTIFDPAKIIEITTANVFPKHFADAYNYAMETAK